MTTAILYNTILGTPVRTLSLRSDISTSIISRSSGSERVLAGCLRRGRGRGTGVSGRGFLRTVGRRRRTGKRADQASRGSGIHIVIALSTSTTISRATGPANSARSIGGVRGTISGIGKTRTSIHGRIRGVSKDGIGHSFKCLIGNFSVSIGISSLRGVRSLGNITSIGPIHICCPTSSSTGRVTSIRGI